MSNHNTCGECKYFEPDDISACCEAVKIICNDKAPACKGFEPKPKPINGDVIRQGNNRKLAEIFDDLYNGNKCKNCIHHAGSGVCKLTNQHAEYDEGEFDEDEVCVDGFEAWLNAPAESEGEDEP